MKRPFDFLLFMCFFLLTGLFSCGNEPAGNNTGVTEEKKESTVSKLQGIWEDRRDRHHKVVFENDIWIEYYKGKGGSGNPLTFYDEYPRKGAKPSPTGRFMRVEEGGNFEKYYLFEILKLDADELELHLIDSDQVYIFRRWEPQYFEDGWGCGGCKIEASFSDPERIGTNVRDAPEGEMLRVLEAKSGEVLRLEILDWYEDWIQLGAVHGNGKPYGGGELYGRENAYRSTWIKTHFASVKVASSSGSQEVDLYDKPYVEAEVTGRAKAGTRLTVTGCCGEWVRVSGTVNGWLAPGSFTP